MRSIKPIAMCAFALCAGLMMATPIASASSYGTSPRHAAANELVGSGLWQGMSATFNTVGAGYATNSFVAYSISLIFPDGWVQLGYLRGWYVPSPHSGLTLCSAPTVYVEEASAGVNTVYTFQTLSIPSTHTFDIHYTGMSGPLPCYSCYVDGVKIRTVVGPSVNDFYCRDFNAQGESDDTNDHCSAQVTFSNLMIGHWVAKKGGSFYMTTAWGYQSGMFSKESDSHWQYTYNTSPVTFTVWLP